MGFELLFLEAVDSSIGRVAHDSFSQQALMEVVIEGITNKEDICGDADERKEIEEWKSVTIEDGEVININWNVYYLEGSVHLGWLPSSVRIFTAINNRLTGTVDWASLPTSMERLDLETNAFTGSICLEKLPMRMEYLDVSENMFCGSLKLESLPKAMIYFVAYNNQFSGSIDFTRLPAALRCL
ncbi:hypothetical protein XU18_1291, partial [Perkinsela sp. CCAP 1560/4]